VPRARPTRRSGSGSAGPKGGRSRWSPTTSRGFDRVASFIEEAVSGNGPHRYSWDETHALNAKIADEHSLPTRDEVVATARESIERVRSVVSRMSDAELAEVAFINGSFPGNFDWLVRTLMPQHADGHLASIVAALAD